MADNYLITGYHGEPHVTAENDRGIQAGIAGTGRYVLPVGERFRAEYIGNNTIRMYNGKLMDNGAAAGIPVGEYVDFSIANAGQGKQRNDLIVFQYSMNTSTMIETGSFVVVQGVESTSTPADPALTKEDLLSGDAVLDQMELYRVHVSGVTIDTPVQLFSVSNPLSSAALANHIHGNVTSEGKLGTASGRIITTGSGGKMQASTPASARTMLGMGSTLDDVAGNTRRIASLENFEERPFDPVTGNPVVIDNYEGMPMECVVSSADSASVNLIRCGRNLVSFPYTNKDGYVSNGITYTVNADGSVTANGTASTESFFYLFDYTVYLAPGVYHLSGTPAGNYGGTIRPQLFVRTRNVTLSPFAAYAEGRTFTVTEGDWFRIVIDIPKGNVLENVTFRPMLVAGSEAAEYEPYQGDVYTVTPGETITIPALGGKNTLIADGDSLTVSGRKDILALTSYLADQIRNAPTYADFEGVEF